MKVELWCPCKFFRMLNPSSKKALPTASFVDKQNNAELNNAECY